MVLNFGTELPPGAHIVGSGSNLRGVNKDETEAELRSRPGEWSLVYENTAHKTAIDWRKRPGIQVAIEGLKSNAGSKSKKYKVWLRYVGIESDKNLDTPRAENVAPRTELDQVNDPTTFDDADEVDISEAPLPDGVTVPQTVDPFEVQVPVGTGDSAQSTQPPAPLPPSRMPLPSAPQTAFQQQFVPES